MAHLVLAKSPGGSCPQAGTVFPLNAPRIVIGRPSSQTPPGAEMILLPHHAVSRQHAEIIQSDGGFVIRDLMSRASTFVNSKPCPHGAELPLADGDRIKICDFLFVFHAGAPEDEADAPFVVVMPPAS